MNLKISHIVRAAFETAKRDPARTAEFVTDVLLIVGLITLVYIAWGACRGAA